MYRQDFHVNFTRNHRCKDMNRRLDNARRYLDGHVWKRAPEKPDDARAALFPFENHDRCSALKEPAGTSANAGCPGIE